MRLVALTAVILSASIVAHAQELAPPADPPAQERGSDAIEDPAFWIIAIGAALAIGGAVGAGVYAATEPSGYAGTIGIRFDI